MRTFFAVDLPTDLADAIEGVQTSLKGAEGLRFTDPEQAHITLKFLGEIEGDELGTVTDAVADAIDETDVDPFAVDVGGLGVFPSIEYISVVWAGVGDGAVELATLHETLEAATTDLGFDPEAHEFTPHVTLARMDDARGKELVQRVVRNEDPSIGTFTASEVVLMESTLTPDGPEYDVVERFEL